MKSEETPETNSEKDINERLRELELLVQYQEIEKQLVREEGRRDGIKYIIEVAGVLVAILVAVGIATIWRNTVTTTQVYQERIFNEMSSTLEARFNETNSIIETRTFEQEITRSAAIATRTFEQEGTRTADLVTRAYEEVNKLSAEVDAQTMTISNTIGILNQEIPTVVYYEVDRFFVPEELQAVAIEIIQTRTVIALQNSFSQTVKIAVVATTDAISTKTLEDAAILSTPASTATPTSTP